MVHAKLNGTGAAKGRGGGKALPDRRAGAAGKVTHPTRIKKPPWREGGQQSRSYAPSDERIAP